MIKLLLELPMIHIFIGKNIFTRIHFILGLLPFFEADIEFEDSEDDCYKTTNIYKQNLVCNGYYTVSELYDVLQSGNYESPLDYNNFDWFAKEIGELENKLVFYFKNTKKDSIMTEEDEKDYRNNKICRFCDKNSEADKVRGHCHLTGKYRRPAHSNCKINVKQKHSNSIPFISHNFSNCDRHLFSKKLVDKKNDKVNFDIIPKTNEKHISVTCGCISFANSYRF